jgi:hypothetical protein
LFAQAGGWLAQLNFMTLNLPFPFIFFLVILIVVLPLWLFLESVQQFALATGKLTLPEGKTKPLSSKKEK